MLGCTCRIHLGIHRPRIWCSRAYAQHQHERIQGLCQRFQIIFSCVPELHAQHKCLKNHDLQSFSLNTIISTHAFHIFLLNKKINNHVLHSFSLDTQHQIEMCSRALRSTKNISSTMCFRVHAQHKQTYIYYLQLAYAQYMKQIIMFICSVVFDPLFQNKTST